MAILANDGFGPLTSVASLPDPGFAHISSAFAANGDFASDPETAMEPRIRTHGASERLGGVLAEETCPYGGTR